MSRNSTLVTANLERGRGRAWAWLEEVLDQRGPAVVFGQELTGVERLNQLADRHGYEVIWPDVELDSSRQVVSWVMAKQELSPQKSTDDALLARLRIHTSYVAAATLEWKGIGRVTLLSMHASPSAVPTADVEHYPGVLRSPRHGGDGVRDSGRYFYSDLLLDAVADAASRGPVLAAGDLNEARAWDKRNPGQTWGAEFFENVTESGLRDVTWDRWGEERRTRFHPTHPGYQLDVVLASPAVADLIVEPEVDADWTETSITAGDRSDHAPVWFKMAKQA